MSPVGAAEWPAINADELHMTSEPLAPKAGAIYLYRQIDADDLLHVEKVYVRIKILNDEGRAQANVSIPFDKNYGTAGDIEARTIHPDGSVVDFGGTVYEKPVLEGRDVRKMSKTFTLNDVQAGDIIEYRFKYISYGNFFNSHWFLSTDLYTKLAKFSLVPYRGYVLRSSSPAGLPLGTEGPTFEHGVYRLTAHDIPAFVSEEYMPPADELKMRVDFAYLRDSVVDPTPAAFWRRRGKRWYEEVERVIYPRRAMQEAVAQIVSTSDSPEQKLRKLYARAQQIRNLTFERPKSVQETERQSERDNADVKDVLKHEYGNQLQIAWLFLALARTAGFEADPALAAPRSRFIFNVNLEDPTLLNVPIVIVKLDGRDMFLDPGTPFAPFGALPWGSTGVTALRLDENGGTWVETPLPEASASRIDRKANLHLSPDGTVEGTATFTFSGLEALTRRLEMRNEDEAARTRFLENEITSDIPTGSTVTLTNAPDWNSANNSLVAIFDVKVEGWAARAGQRALVPMGLFSGADKHSFEHATRIHPVYFRYPHQIKDDITIELPPGWLVSNLPKPYRANIKVADYVSVAQNDTTQLHLNREFTLSTLLLQPKFYGLLQDFFNGVRAADADQTILSVAAGPVVQR